MTHWDRTLRAHVAQFYAEPQRSVDHQRAIDWINWLKAQIAAAPAVVTDAASLGGVEDALSDIEGDVNGFYRKEAGQ